MTRQEAERTFSKFNYQEGDYIVREREQSETYALSFMLVLLNICLVFIVWAKKRNVSLYFMLVLFLIKSSRDDRYMFYLFLLKLHRSRETKMTNDFHFSEFFLISSFFSIIWNVREIKVKARLTLSHLKVITNKLKISFFRQF